MDSIIIVDEEDRVIGSKPRDKIDFENDIYRASALWVTNSKGQVLLAQRSFNKVKSPGLWGPAASGTIEAGETYESNMYKEAEEEIGLMGVEFKKGPKQFVGKPRQKFIQWYICALDRKLEDFEIQEEEVEDIRWVGIEELKKDLEMNPDKYVSALHSAIDLLKI